MIEQSIEQRVVGAYELLDIPTAYEPVAISTNGSAPDVSTLFDDPDMIRRASQILYENNGRMKQFIGSTFGIARQKLTDYLDNYENRFAWCKEQNVSFPAASPPAYKSMMNQFIESHLLSPEINEEYGFMHNPFLRLQVISTVAKKDPLSIELHAKAVIYTILYGPNKAAFVFTPELQQEQEAYLRKIGLR